METNDINQLLTKLGVQTSCMGYFPMIRLIQINTEIIKSGKTTSFMDLCRETAAAMGLKPTQVNDNIKTIINNYWKTHTHEDFKKITGFPAKYDLPVKEFIAVLTNYICMNRK